MSLNRDSRQHRLVDKAWTYLLVGLGSANVLLSVVLCLLAVWLGHWLGQVLSG